MDEEQLIREDQMKREMFGPTPGIWFLHSQKDPRWDTQGRSEHVGGFLRPKETIEAEAKLRAQYGNPPDDLEWAYLKD